MKYYIKTVSTIFILFLILRPSSVYASLWCGMSVTTDVALDSDLYCGSDGVGYALKVETNNIKIDLNGYRIYGSNEALGIVVNGARGFELIGNGGSVSNFERALDLNDSKNATVRGVLFYENRKASITSANTIGNSHSNQFINNTFIFGDYGIRLLGRAGFESLGHVIADNQFYKVGVNVETNLTNGNKIQNNFIWKAEVVGVSLHASNNNYLNNNEILEVGDTAISIINSTSNKIHNNTFDGGYYGLIFTGEMVSGVCSGLQISQFNEVEGNYFFNYNYGLLLWADSCGEVTKNYINYNKIYNNNVGVFIASSPQNNNLTSNAFTGTVTPVIDFSDGSNIY